MSLKGSIIKILIIMMLDKFFSISKYMWSIVHRTENKN